MRVVIFFLSLLMLATLVAGQTKESGKTESLMEAVEEGNLKELRELLEKDGNPNFIDKKEGVSPLILACILGRADMVKRLIDAKADVELRDTSNNATPLMWAAIRDPGKEAREKGIPTPSLETKTEIARLLLQAGAKAKVRDNWGGTPLLWAAEEGNVSIVKMLIEAGGDLNEADSDGLTPLMAAANLDSANHIHTTRLVIASGADVNAVNQKGETALFHAINNFRTENVQALLAAGAKVNHQNHAGFSALMRAAQLARFEIMKVLLQNGADVNTKNAGGDSVLEVARRARHDQAVQLLLQAGAK